MRVRLRHVSEHQIHHGRTVVADQSEAWTPFESPLLLMLMLVVQRISPSLAPPVTIYLS
eukprot:m.285483 g.285483  ORF g.285483 m.285483 type:complete len:59 (+) comp27034_c2_seq21:2058-2234(+)